jgi:single-strand DNA-binding protein
VNGEKMFDTTVTIVGNVLNMPEWRRLEKSGTLVANFKIASTARRFDRGSGRWIDGDSLRVRVTCWRRLAEGVTASVKVGDPVIVHGRLYTRDWTTEDGQRRVMYELDAVSVGHDLARGIGIFKRVRPELNTSVVEDADTDSRVGGENSESVPELNEKYHARVSDYDDDLPYGEPDLEYGPPAVEPDGQYTDPRAVPSTASDDLDRVPVNV